jgi:hypothetical protein
MQALDRFSLVHLLFMLSFFTDVWAGNEKILKKMNETTNAIKGLSPATHSCLTERIPEISETQFEQLFATCAIDLCGHPKTKKLSNDYYPNEDYWKTSQGKRILSPYENEIIPIAKKIITIVLEKHKQELIQSQQLLENDKNLNIKSSDYYLHNAFFFLNHMSKLGWKIENNILTIDPEHSRKNLHDLPKEVAERFLTASIEFLDTSFGKEYRTLLLSYANLRKENLFDQAQLFDQLHPGLALKDALIKDATDLEKKILELKTTEFYKAMEELKSFDSDELVKLDFVRSVAKGANLTASEIDNYLGTKMTSFLLFRLGLERKSLSHLNNELIIGDAKSFTETTEFKKKLNDSIDKSNSERTSIIYKALVQFGSTYANESAISPTQDQITEAERLVHIIKDAMEQKLLPYFSKETQGLLQHTINKTSFKFPESMEQYHNKIKKKLELRLVELEKHAKASENINKKALLYSIYSDFDLLKDLQSEFDLSKGSQTLFTDNLHTINGTIEISKGSVLAPELGRSVILHELGHRISYEVFQKPGVSEASKKLFNDVRECLDERYADEPNYEKFKGRYVEEDWADLVSALALDSPDETYSCAFFARSEEGQGYTPMGLLQTSETDTHSALLFRALHIHRARHPQFPESCEKALKSLKNPPDFSSCFSRAIQQG